MRIISKITIFFLISLLCGGISIGYTQEFTKNPEVNKLVYPIYSPTLVISRLPPYEDLLGWEKVKNDTIPYYDKLVAAGDVLSAKEQRKAARNWYRFALPYYVLFKRNKLSSLYGKIANTYRSSDNSLAIKYYLKALRYIGDEQKPEIVKAKLYTNIASIFIDIHDYDKALSYLNRAQPIFKNGNDSVDAAIVFNNRGLIYRALKENKKAIENYLSALSLINNMVHGRHDPRVILVKYWIVGNLSVFYIDEDNPDLALFYLNEIKEDIPFLPLSDQTSFKFLYGKILVEKKEYKAATEYLQQSLHISEQQKFKNITSWANRSLANLYIGQKDYKSALQYTIQYINAQYEVFQEDRKNINNIQNLESKYQLSLRDNELSQKQLLIARQEKHLVQQKLIIGMIALAVLALIIIIGILYRNHHRKQKLLLQQEEIERLKATMKGEEKERGRISHELHDGIISQLTAVRLQFSSLLQQDKPIDRQLFEQGFNYLNETVRDLRKTAHNLMPESVIKNSLIGAVRDFCSKMDNENATRIHFLTNGDYISLDKTQELSLYRMIQELVQNALKYAHANNLIVQLNYFGGQLEVTVEDDGTGFDANIAQYNGTGLNNIRERVKMINGHIEIASEAGKGTTIYLEIPIIADSKNV